MDILTMQIEAFLDVGNGDGDGNGYGDGNGDGNGYGYGYGDGDGNGYGYGDGDGYGYGYGDGNGYGDGYGYGNGYGYGYGYGDGNGYGDGIKEYEGYLVYNVDGVPTIITSLHRNIAQGFTCKHNRFTVPCYVARVGNYFAHGSTAKEALRDAQAKYEQNRPIAERIKGFIDNYPSLDTIALNSELYVWHNVLTGSCAFGRQQFAEQHEIYINNGSMSVKEFIILTQNSYKGDIIKQLHAAYGTS